ncbi:Class I SAM-dependent methyltransferase [Candidatus Megaera venefica]|uniref:Class I SAM-dependent methyltransferase n=1 Tax=Candidatus Megaera venefica TaxID=2055910 RepID=A0ABU5NBG5_9RICK|nr:class I SAM-dependent methyltransferase [Candidatus Megaera venefica]MEA0970524.1 Class I SAM-dependent methyltransferase [Candidatus Megaera venefica]
MTTKQKTGKTKDLKGLKEVQEHYLDYPYPLRNPEDDKTRILKIYGDYLGEINHWLFDGKKDFKKGFRVLIAGGGTGDSTVYLAEQLKDTDAEVIYLDFSKNSMAIAQKRAEYRGLTNITWIHDSILNIPALKLGKFDYITCTGVLHHLESPDDGLKVLADSLTDDGGMGIMVYAQYGRTGVYQMQDMLRMVNEGITSRQEEVKNGWAVVNALPNTNWYKRGGAELSGDLGPYGDVGMYDMFLHKQDRAYTVPQLYEFVEKAGLNFVEYNSAYSRVMLKPETYFQDPEFLKKIKAMDKWKQQAVCEIMCGSIVKHSFYVSKKKNTIAKITDLDNVLYIYIIHDIPLKIADHIKINQSRIGSSIGFSFKSDDIPEVSISIPVSHYTEHLFRNMISGDKSLGEIHKAIEKDLGKKVSDSEFLDELNRIFPVLEEVGVFLQRNKKINIAQFC